MLQEISLAEQTEIYLVKDVMTPYTDYPSSYMCSHVYFRMDSDNRKIFEIHGDVEESMSDEFFGLSVTRGWSDFELYESTNELIIKWGEAQSEVTDSFLTRLQCIASLGRAIVRTINVEELKDTDMIDALIITGKEQETIFVGQHVLPYSILVTLDNGFVKQLIN